MKMEFVLIAMGAVLVVVWLACASAGGAADVHFVYTSDVRGTVGICG